jgi:multidrug efflux pump subunit AcrA (membrane-fusion protein)
MVGCKRDSHSHDTSHADSVHTDAPSVSNRLDVPEAVRRNLGITFARAERRVVRGTVRVPGQFELLPEARREYRTVLPARVSLLVRQYQVVSAGTLMARIDSPEWRRVQHEAVEAEGEIKTAEAQREVALATVAENERAVALLRQRTAALAEANAPRADLTAELSLAEVKAARLSAELRAADVRLAEAHEHFASRLRVLSSVVDVPVADLLATVPRSTQPAESAAAESLPRWRAIDAIEVRATAAGVVDRLAVTDGGWLEAGGLLMTVADPARVRFRATALQADWAKLSGVTLAQVLPPRGVGGHALNASVVLGTEANSSQRSFDMLLTLRDDSPTWARAGLAALAEFATAGSAEPELAIPLSAVVQDELTSIFFRRDPANPDKVVRTAADLGVSDGRWVVVHSGLKAGDEVVVDGVYELKLTGAGKAGGGGHFHADGTWHPAGTPEK